MTDITSNLDLGDIGKKFLTFEIDGQAFGFSIDSVKEIIKVEPATLIPEVPIYVKGIINLRGRIITLIDVNLRLALPEKEYTDRTCIINVEIENKLVGFIVDMVYEVIDIEDKDISREATTMSQARPYLDGVGKTEKGIVLLLDSKKIVDKNILNVCQ